MRTVLFIVAMFGAGLSLTACADRLPGKPMTAEGFEIAVARSKLMIEAGKKFDASHPLKGQVADTALRQLHDEGYTCHIDYVDHLKRNKDFTPYFVRTPLVFCAQRSPGSNDICAERHVNLNIGWQDPKATEPELRLQLTSSVITDRAFRCDEASEVGR